MRILLIGLNFAPEPTGVGKYSGEMADWLARRGHNVAVVTAPPYYPFWKIGAGHRSWTWRREKVGASDVLRCPLYVPARPGGMTRLLHLASFGLSSLPAALVASWRLKPDLVVATVPTLCAVPSALAAARMTGARRWVHIQDLEVDAAFDLGILPKGWFRRMALWIERWLLSRFDLVTSISTPLLERLAEKGIAPSKLAFFPNWVDVATITRLPPNLALRRQLGIPDGRVVASYSGSMGEKHGLETLIEVARQSTGTSLHFVIAGDGPGKTQIAAAASGLPNVTLLPLQPAETLNDFLALADLHLLPQRADAADLVMPSKLGAMLASGRPIVATVAPGSPVARAITSCGAVTPPGDADALARTLHLLAADPVRREKLGIAARQAAMALAQDEVLGEIEGRLMGLTGG